MDVTSTKSERRNHSKGTADFMKMYKCKTKSRPHAPPTDSSDSEEDGEARTSVVRKVKSRANIGWQSRHKHTNTNYKRVMIIGSSSGSSSSSDAESGAITVMKGNSYLRANIGWQPIHKTNIHKDGGVRSISSSSSSPSDAAFGANQVVKVSSASGANIGGQLRHEQTNNRVMILGSSSSGSSSSGSSSSESESLLSPSKLKLVRTQPAEQLPLAQIIQLRNQLQSDARMKRSGLQEPIAQSKADQTSDIPPISTSKAQQISRTKVPEKQKDCNTSSSHRSSLHRTQDVPFQQQRRGKHGLNKESDQDPRYKRARVSSTYGIVISGSSSSSSDDDTSPGQELSSTKSQNRPLKKTSRLGESTKTVENAYQNPIPKSVSRQKMLDLFGWPLSDDEDGDVTEEDIQEVKDGHENAVDAFVGVGKAASSIKIITPTLVDLVNNSCITDEAHSKKNLETFSTQGPYSSTQTKSSSGRVDSVILVDITQSEERGALSGQSSPKLKLYSTNSTSPEGSSPVFSQHKHNYKGPTYKYEDIGSNSEPIVIGDVQVNGGNAVKSANLKSPDTSTESRLVLGARPKDSHVNSVCVFSGRPRSNKETKNQQSTPVVQDHNQSVSPILGRSSGSDFGLGMARKGNSKVIHSTVFPQRSLSPILGRSSGSDFGSGMARKGNSKVIHSTVFPQRSRESSETSRTSNSKQQTTLTIVQDDVHFPRTSFEENRFNWLQQTRDSEHDNVGKKSPLVTRNPVSTFRDGDSFVGPRSKDESLQPSEAKDAADAPLDRHQLSEAQQNAHNDAAKSPTFGNFVRRKRKRTTTTQNSLFESSQSPETSAADLSFEENHRRWSDQMREDTEAVFSSSSSLDRSRGTMKHDHHHVKRPKPQLRKGGLNVGGASSIAAEPSKGHTGQVSKETRSQGSRQHQRGDDSSAISVLAGQGHSSRDSQPEVQIVGIQGPRPKNTNDTSRSQTVRRRAKAVQSVEEVGSQGPRQHNTRSSVVHVGRTEGDLQPDVQILQSHSSKQITGRLPTKVRNKSKQEAASDQMGDVRSRGARQRRGHDNLGSLAIGRSTTDSQPDVQLAESQDSIPHSRGRSSVRGGGEGTISERPLSPDIAEMLRQLDEDEAMAKQLQEQYDSELARQTQQYNETTANQHAMYHDIDNPVSVIPPPQLPRYLPYAQPTVSFPGCQGPGREMTWRDDLVDVSAAMMAEMGRFTEAIEIQPSQSTYARQRRGRGRGRGRSRNRGHHHNHMQSIDTGGDYESLWSLAERVGPAVSKGLPESSINLLPTFLYTSGKDANENECSICMGDYETGENMRRLPCFHFYHAACIDKWLKENRICPVCREEVNFDPVNFS